jgi:gas vesicle protein
MNNSTKRIALGTLIAGAVGYVAGILTAPKSGVETRGSIKNASDTSIAEAEKQLKKLHTELTELLGQLGEKGDMVASKIKSGEVQDEVVSKAKVAKQKTREIISAIHEGSADDKDLDKAVNEAGKAIKALRNYLKK